jgi:hypothetical protein
MTFTRADAQQLDSNDRQLAPDARPDCRRIDRRERVTSKQWPPSRSSSARVRSVPEREPALARQLQLPQQLPGALPIRTRQRSGPCSR